MKAGIITIGDEILVGQTIDTNSAYIASKLRELGISIFEIRTISDQETAIIRAVEDLSAEADILFITGGLGPTKDDITKKVLCGYFNDSLAVNDEVLNKIKTYFASIDREMLEVHYQQADLPVNAETIINDLGTASGMWFKAKGKNVISMPGVPYEMKGLMEKIIPRVKQDFNIGNFYHRTILFQGIGESTLAHNLSDIEIEAATNKISMAYLPSIGTVKIRFTGATHQKNIIDDFIIRTNEIFSKQIFGEEETSLEEVIGKILIERKQTLGTVESCTAGNLSARIVSVPGASDYYEGSLITYSYGLKSKLANVNAKMIIDKGAVSEEVILEMAQKGREMLGVDYCLATSGIAGPGGGTEDKPVGTVWIGLATKTGVKTQKFSFKQNRERNIELTISYALNMLRKELLGIN